MPRAPGRSGSAAGATAGASGRRARPPHSSSSRGATLGIAPPARPRARAILRGTRTGPTASPRRGTRDDKRRRGAALSTPGPRDLRRQRAAGPAPPPRADSSRASSRHPGVRRDGRARGRRWAVRHAPPPTPPRRRAPTSCCVERYNHLGGLSTGGLVIWIDRMTDWTGRQVIRGFTEEIIDRLPAEG